MFKRCAWGGAALSVSIAHGKCTKQRTVFRLYVKFGRVRDRRVRRLMILNGICPTFSVRTVRLVVGTKISNVRQMSRHIKSVLRLNRDSLAG